MPSIIVGGYAPCRLPPARNGGAVAMVLGLVVAGMVMVVAARLMVMAGLVVSLKVVVALELMVLLTGGRAE